LRIQSPRGFTQHCIPEPNDYIFKEKRSAMSKVLLLDIVKVNHYQKKSEFFLMLG